VHAIVFYLGLAALLTLEEAGLFLLPGDISLIGAGVYGAQGGPAILVSWLGAGAAMCTGALVLFTGVRRTSATSRILPARARDLILRHGSRGVLAARLVPGLRNATVFAAAASDLPVPAFLLGLVPAAFLWSGALLLLGYFGGSAILTLAGQVEGSPLLKGISAVFFLSAAAYTLLRLRRAEVDPPVTAGGE
jgi:membrane protein DedA with SNARE-associated domain